MNDILSHTIWSCDLTAEELALTPYAIVNTVSSSENICHQKTIQSSKQVLVSAVGVIHILRTLYLSKWTNSAYDITMILFLISDGHILTPPVYTLACLDWHKFASIEPSSSWILLHKHWSDFLLKYNDAQFSCAFVKKKYWSDFYTAEYRCMHVQSSARF